MKAGIIENNILILKVDCETESQLQELMTKNGLVVDLSGYDPEPANGWIWDGSKLSDPEGSSQSKKITRLGLRNRLTFTELVTLTTAAKSNAAVQVLLDNLAASTYVDLSRPDTIGAMQMLVGAGLLTAQRGNEILNNPITEIEKYRGDK